MRAATVLAGLLCLALGACALPDRPIARSVPDQRFAGRVRFAFLPDPLPVNGAKRGLASHLHEAAKTSLQDRGYTLAEPEQADFLIVGYVNFNEPPNSGAYGYAEAEWRAGHGPEVGPITRRTAEATAWELGWRHDPREYMGLVVIVDAVDRQAGELLWRGWARKQEPLRDITHAEIGEIARAILEQFPAVSAPPAS